ncbi:MAG: hypothetical protein RR444_11175, partial [Oscillospiraceae bacterium]
MTVITESNVQQFVLDRFSTGLARKTVRDLVAVLKAVVKYGGKHKIFPFEEWEVEYPTNTNVRRLPILALNHQRILMCYLIEKPTTQN